MHYTEYPVGSKEYKAAYMRDYRRRHPEATKELQLRSQAGWLVRHGYTVIDPNGNPVKAKSKE